MPDTIEQTVITEWCVHIRGTVAVLPALSRADAYERANEVNTRTVTAEQNTPAQDPDYRPVTWAVPMQRWQGTPLVTTRAEIEADWSRWNA